LPQLVERAGNSDRGAGSITAFYTVLAEGDDQNDPIADAARAILDGHIVLSRRLAESGLYPAIDIEASISRAMHSISTRERLDLATRFKQVYSTYQQNRDLITVGAYRRGSDPRVDLAMDQWPKMLEFLRQDMYEPVNIERSFADLKQLVTQFSAPAAAGVR
jgi:flagellum-specific ATP synthase